MIKQLFIFIIFFCIAESIFAQNNNYWQQQVDYKIDVVMDSKNYQYKGKQELIYTNNSPDTLRKVYYHLFFNAFQPNSEMDVRLQTIKDPDKRMVTNTKVGDKITTESRIKSLKPNEIGYLKITNLKQDGLVVQTKETGTIMEVILAKPILPNSKTTFVLNFDGQLPVHIRRAGRNSPSGAEFSMAQWYPKIAEFDFEGWHADPYIAREFHGVWGNFDVKITIDKEYTIGGTGYLQNKNEIGHGYQDAGTEIVYPKKTKTLTWHFYAPMVHDFAWAADKDYTHDIVKGFNDVELHFLYKKSPATDVENWKKIQPYIVQVLDFYNKKVGIYPYKQYSFIQGGDGGMEYAMCTLVLGTGTFDGMLGTATHEFGHSWFQQILASNESKHPWMDEGFTTYIEDLAMNEISSKKLENPFATTYDVYYRLVNSGKEQPQSTHSDRYDENKSYSISSYIKGSIFLSQLGYIIGSEKLNATIKRFYNDFKFKHPTPNDIIRSAERVSDAELDWYLTEWTQTTNTIDYGIKEVSENQEKTSITLERIGRIPMPIDLSIEYKDGTKENFYIPLRMMHYIKENQTLEVKRTVLNDWAWAYPTFKFEIDKPKKDIKKITIDPSGLMADVKQDNNIFVN